MYVDSGVRRKGYGRAILQALLTAASERGYSQIILETTDTWAEAIAFYEANGFQRVREGEGAVHFVKEIR
jgi:ribosomal protein S18 acetylase RimI-like enzyme